jgi:hypothetical protein
MRKVFVFLLLCLFTIGSLGCGSGTRSPTGDEEDTAANPPAEMMPPAPGETPQEVK